MPNDVILPEDPASAVRYQLGEPLPTGETEVWMARGMPGILYTSEAEARRAGCTHVRCKCGHVHAVRDFCVLCRKRHDQARYLALPIAETWTGPIYSDARSEWFADVEQAADQLEPGEHINDLMLVTTEPVTMPELTADYFVDYLPEDYDHIPSEIADAIDGFNARVHGVVSCYTAGKFRIPPHPQCARCGHDEHWHWDSYCQGPDECSCTDFIA